MDDPTGGNGNDMGRYLDPSNNPVYGTYMHSLWRSAHGSGGYAVVLSKPRNEYQSLEEWADAYGATIIENMLTKLSGYNLVLTAEEICIMGVWMAFVQSLYDAVSLCTHNPNIDGNVAVIVVSNVVYVSPVEAAAAFWYRSRSGNGNGNVGGEVNNNGSMFVWAGAACANFDGADFVANDKIGSGLMRLQPLLMECLGYRNGRMMTKIALHARRTRTITDNVVRYATVPMVQNRGHHSARIASGVVKDTATTVAMVDTLTGWTLS